MNNQSATIALVIFHFLLPVAFSAPFHSINFYSQKKGREKSFEFTLVFVVPKRLRRQLPQLLRLLLRLALL